MREGLRAVITNASNRVAGHFSGLAEDRPKKVRTDYCFRTFITKSSHEGKGCCKTFQVCNGREIGVVTSTIGHF